MSRKDLDPKSNLDRVGLLLASQLDRNLESLSPDIGERLRFARDRAVARARQARLQGVGVGESTWATGSGSALVVGGRSGGWSVNLLWGGSGNGNPRWSRWVSVLPLCILGLGFLAIQDTLQERQIQAAAEVDAALLADDLPPQAYADPGFAEFLRRPAR